MVRLEANKKRARRFPLERSDLEHGLRYQLGVIGFGLATLGTEAAGVARLVDVGTDAGRAKSVMAALERNGRSIDILRSVRQRQLRSCKERQKISGAIHTKQRSQRNEASRFLRSAKSSFQSEGSVTSSIQLLAMDDCMVSC